MQLFLPTNASTPPRRRATGLGGLAPLLLAAGVLSAPAGAIRAPGPGAPEQVPRLLVEAAEGRNRARLERALESGELGAGTIPIQATLDATPAAGGLSIQVSVRPDAPAGPSAVWLLSAAAASPDARPALVHRTVTWSPSVSLAGAPQTPTGGFRTSLVLPLMDDLQEAAVALEHLDSGRWGAAWISEAATEGQGDELSADLEILGPAERPEPVDPETPLAGRAPAAGSSHPGDPSSNQLAVVTILPPRDSPAVGRQRIRTVASLDGIRKVLFFLDGRLVATDSRSPFAATLDFGPEAAAHLVEVRALGFDDLLLGTSSLRVNPGIEAFAVSLAVAEVESGLEVAARVTVPPWSELASVEFFAGSNTLGPQREPPFSALLPEGLDPSTVIRVLARFADGTDREDAGLLRDLLRDDTFSERVEVNLVEVYATVTDRDGRPVPDLEASAFRLRLGKRPVQIERFGAAGDLPLSLGLIVDSSESMDSLMTATRQAAAQFLASSLGSEDRAFLVDFDSRPRLARSMTGELATLLEGLGRLQVGGNTAIYDAVAFSLAQFDSGAGRRALVLLTDGRDYGSRIDSSRCLAEARKLGVPVYVIVLANQHAYLPGAGLPGRKTPKAPPADAFLEAFAEKSGGRLISVTDVAALAAVYQDIGAELRSQYFLGFTTPERLNQDAIESLRLEVAGRGFEVRSSVLGR